MTKQKNRALQLTSIESPLGTLTVGFSDKGLALLTFSQLDTLKLPKGFDGIKIARHLTERHELLQQELTEYFDGSRTTFSTPLDLQGTDFQKRVWHALLEIPHSMTRSYKKQAILLGDVKAIRAVATANSANPIAILVPCHRVIGSDLSLTGYAGGLNRKRFLLELESNQGKLF